MAGDSGPRRFCANADYDVCNWLTRADGQDRLCVACRHNDTIPDISEASHLIAWRDIEAMLEAAGAKVTEGEGSRVRIALNWVRAVFHRPHPKKETDKGAVRSMRRLSEWPGPGRRKAPAELS